MPTAKIPELDFKFKGMFDKEIDLGCASKIVLTKQVNNIDVIEATIPAHKIEFKKVLDSECRVYFKYKGNKYILVDIEDIDKDLNNVKDKAIEKHYHDIKVRKILDEIRILILEKFDSVTEDFHLYETSNAFNVLLNIGLDSLHIAELVMFIEEKYKIKISEERLDKINKFQDLAQIIIEGAGLKNE